MEWLLAWRNKEKSRMIILENGLRMLALLIVGCLIGKGEETMIFFIVFYGLRTQAGGARAKTVWGCGIGMFSALGITLYAAGLVRIPPLWMVVLFAAFVFVVIWKVPQTADRACYTPEQVMRKKVICIIILWLCVMLSIVCREWSNLMMCAVTLEMATVLLGNG